jgi:hypothetical protein
VLVVEVRTDATNQYDEQAHDRREDRNAALELGNRGEELVAISRERLGRDDRSSTLPLAAKTALRG